MRRFRSAPLAAFVLAAVAAGSLATAAPASAAPTSAAQAKKPATVTVMVTNDDGYNAPGIDTLVQALRKVKNTKVLVIAPATNQTGKGGSTSPTPLATSAAKTASGYDATAVQGTPADTVTAALDQLGVKPDVVMSGINIGQNMGTLVDLSGTVGAARMAARRGIPAVALSQGFGDVPQYGNAAKLAVAWLTSHRAALAKKPTKAPTAVVNINVPNCPSGKPRGVKQVTTATTNDKAIAEVDCTSTLTKPTTDIEGFNAGWAVEAPVSIEPTTPTS